MFRVSGETGCGKLCLLGKSRSCWPFRRVRRPRRNTVGELGDNMTKFLCAVALSVSVLSVPAVSEPLDHKQLRTLFPGRYVVKVMGNIDLKVNMQANGTVTGLSMGQRDSGRWSVESGKLCIAWNTWNNGRKDCSALSRDGAKVKGRGFWFLAA